MVNLQDPKLNIPILQKKTPQLFSIPTFRSQKTEISKQFESRSIFRSDSQFNKTPQQFGLSPLPVIVANEGLGWDSRLKMVHNPGGDWNPGRGDNLINSNQPQKIIKTSKSPGSLP